MDTNENVVGDTVAESTPETDEQYAARIFAEGWNFTGTFFYDTVEDVTWKTWTIEDENGNAIPDVKRMIEFRDRLEAFTGAAAMLREDFDKAVWTGHSDGSVNTAIQSIRTQRSGETPGKKAAVLTPAEKLAKRLKK